MAIQMQMNGVRLAYVVRPIEGNCNRVITTYEKGKGLVQQTLVEPGGFMVYFPRGHCLRLQKKELKHYNLDRPAPFVNLGEITDPNSIIGKLVMAQDEGARRGAFADLEKQVIALATRKTGARVLTRDVRPEREAA